MGKTRIEWSEFVWNPVTGCSKVSEGCRFCFAERMARRLAGRYGYPEAPHHFDVTLRPDRLDIPLKRKKPTLYFVCSMSDLFHEDVSFEFIGKVFAVMIAIDRHTFQVLTKRPERMLRFISWFQTKTALSLRPFRHIWLGTSVENQATADERIPLLLQTPAAVRFVSVEPMLESIQFYDKTQRCATLCVRWAAGAPSKCPIGRCYAAEGKIPEGIDWVICGGESGPDARPMHPDWARSLRDQCQAAEVSFFFKQWGAWLGVDYSGRKVGDTLLWDLADGSSKPIDKKPEVNFGDGHGAVRVGKKCAGHLLDGRTWQEFPKCS